jgi:hypothetical protein
MYTAIRCHAESGRVTRKRFTSIDAARRWIDGKVLGGSRLLRGRNIYGRAWEDARPQRNLSLWRWEIEAVPHAD